MAGEAWIWTRRQGEHDDIEPLACERASECLPHGFVGSDDSTHRLAGIDQRDGRCRDRIVLPSVIENNE